MVLQQSIITLFHYSLTAPILYVFNDHLISLGIHKHKHKHKTYDFCRSNRSTNLRADTHVYISLLVAGSCDTMREHT